MSGRSPGPPGRRVLVTGLPRSGTTWVGQVLGRAGDTVYVHEPDNDLIRPEAHWAKRDLGPYPALAPEDQCPVYERLWTAAFAGGPRPSLRYTAARSLHRVTGRPDGAALLAWVSRSLVPAPPPAPARAHVVVKSVHACRVLDWVSARFDPAVVVLDRHPFGVISSWAALGWTAFLDQDPVAVAAARRLGVAPVPPEAGWLERAAWHYGLLTAGLARSVAAHPGWHLVRHEDLCADPQGWFPALCAAIGLPWRIETAAFLAASNRPGRGYSTKRVWQEHVDAGRTRLTPGEQARILEVLATFPAERLTAAAATTPPAPPPLLESPAPGVGSLRRLPAGLHDIPAGLQSM